MKTILLAALALMFLNGCAKTATEKIEKANVVMRSHVASDLSIIIEKDSEKLFESNAEKSFVCGRATINQPGLFVELVQRFIITTNKNFDVGLARFENGSAEKIDSEFLLMWIENCQNHVLPELKVSDKKQTAIVARSFDLTVQSIPKNFIPDSPQAIFDAASKIRLLKDEFENTEKYNARYITFSKDMMDKLDLNRELAFEIKPYVTYNADKEMFAYNMDCTKYQCIIDSKDDSNGDHESINNAVINSYGLFSRKIPWNKIIFLKSPNVKQKYMSPSHETFTVKGEDAAKIKNALALIIAGRVVKPFGKKNLDTYPNETNDFHGAVWNEISFELSGIWLINKDTGEILKKHKLLN